MVTCCNQSVKCSASQRMSNSISFKFLLAELLVLKYRRTKKAGSSCDFCLTEPQADFVGTNFSFFGPRWRETKLGRENEDVSWGVQSHHFCITQGAPEMSFGIDSLTRFHLTQRKAKNFSLLLQEWGATADGVEGNYLTHGESGKIIKRKSTSRRLILENLYTVRVWTLHEYPSQRADNLNQ